MPAEPWKHETLTANGLKFHCVTAGEGPLLLLLHGFPQNWSTWRHQIERLSKKYKVVVPDQRGYNDTERPPRVSDYAMNHLVDDMAALISHYGAKSARVVGHDWGAAVAWALAYTRPELVEKLVIINCPHPAVMAKALSGGNFAQMRRSWYIFFFQLPWLPEWFLTKGGASTLARMFKGMVKRKESFTEEDIRYYQEAILKPGAARATLNWYRATFRGVRAQRELRRGGSSNVKAPVRVIWGEDDTALGKELTLGLDRWCKGGLTITYVKNCSHWVPEERPEEVAAWIEEAVA